mgnify:CR=1 FL=1
MYQNFWKTTRRNLLVGNVNRIVEIGVFGVAEYQSGLCFELREPILYVCCHTSVNIMSNLHKIVLQGAVNNRFDNNSCSTTAWNWVTFLPYPIRTNPTEFNLILSFQSLSIHSFNVWFSWARNITCIFLLAFRNKELICTMKEPSSIINSLYSRHNMYLYLSCSLWCVWWLPGSSHTRRLDGGWVHWWS